MTDPWVEPAAWLMRAWRLAAPDPALRRQVGMITALKAHPGVRPGLVAGTLTRYERGELVSPLPIVDALEQVVGIAPGEISSHLRQPVGLAMSRSEQWDLLGRADIADEVPLMGRDWVHLAQQLTAPTGGNLQSPATVARLSRVLVAEMARSIGASYRLRIQAIDLLARDPLTRDPLADAVNDQLRGCGYTVIGDMLGALSDAAHPRSAAIAVATYAGLAGPPLQTAALCLAGELAANPLRADRWSALCAILADDLTDPGGGRQEAAAIVVAALSPRQRAALGSRLSPRAIIHLRDALASTRRATPSPEQTRHLRRQCELLAATLIAETGARPVAGLEHWLRRALLSPFDLQAALVLGSSPFSTSLSEHLQRLENPATSNIGDPQFPGAATVLNSCRRSDTAGLVGAFAAGDRQLKQRLIVPIAHHRALPADADLRRLAVEVGSVSRVLYAAGMSAHPGLRAYGDTLRGHQQQAACWWSEGSAVPA